MPKLKLFLCLLVVTCLMLVVTPAFAGHGGGEFDPATQLNPLSWSRTQTDTALWTAAIFAILIIVLGKFAFTPIAKALDQREQSIADNIAAAEKANLDSKELLAQYRQKLADAQEEVRQILEAGKKEAEQAALAIAEKARAASELERARVAKEIEAATAGALQEIATKGATLATELAGKILRKQIDPAAHRELISQAVNEIR
ncbi:MAG: F0F1 ATP synthase subunit B [Thermoguttaceae bacterium]